ncbi:class C sortase [Bifidobacterium sp. ESL0732]|uniref:class C sortase n=1 Tax=Bifidobacterium sp. ESL0732 TaxID=2983222 RepID=UPI0023F659F8|nr:class C sortase [Bifidobacterium sp. ESL0732]WEV63550.1 class C sortase [Bifidobacterium sp. ESL0732]
MNDDGARGPRQDRRTVAQTQGSRNGRLTLPERVSARLSNGAARTDDTHGENFYKPFLAAIHEGLNHAAVIRKKRRIINSMKAVAALFVVAAVALALWLPANQYVNARRQEAEAVAAMNRVRKWPQGKVVGEYQAAQRYNASIASSTQHSLGEFSDPFASSVKNSNGGRKALTSSQKDTTYQGLLNGGGGVMGVIHIPKISLKLPIYHGTSDEVLDKGVGHLYGTSLPVGGKSTNSVLTGHRGRPYETLFTRLDQLRQGDVIYIDTLGRTMGYRVTAIHVVSPDDVHLYKVQQGKDLVTLMTCTPYGVNTHRLVLTAERRPIPKDIPYPEDSVGDGLLWGTITALTIIAVGIIFILMKHRRHWPIRHAKGWF